MSEYMYLSYIPHMQIVILMMAHVHHKIRKKQWRFLLLQKFQDVIMIKIPIPVP